MVRKSGILLAALLGGAAYWLRQRAQNQARSMPHDITRWEDEGGSFHGDRALALQEKPAAAEPAHPSSAGGSTSDAWEFPRG